MKRALIIGMGAALLAIPLASSAQTAKPAAAAYHTPRNSFGQPDLDGTWTNATITPQTRPAQYGDRLAHTPAEVKQLEGGVQASIAQGNRNTDPNAPTPVAGVDPGGYNRGWLDPGSAVMRVSGQPRTSILTTVNGQPPARKAGAPAAFPGGAPGGGRGGAGAAAARPAAGRGQFDNPEQRPLGERCIISFGRNGGPPMFANGFYNNDYQFVQNKDEVAIVIEMVHDVRHIRLNTKQHQPDKVRPWFGDSIGWYEGDTLVVETTNIPQRQNYQGSWEHLKVVERFNRVAKDRMLYQFTVEDPTIWDKPWGGEYEFATLQGDIHEYACHEGNYALTGILAGARAEEVTAVSKAASR